jgi:hypothetical protein
MAQEFFSNGVVRVSPVMSMLELREACTLIGLNTSEVNTEDEAAACVAFYEMLEAAENPAVIFPTVNTKPPMRKAAPRNIEEAEAARVPEPVETAVLPLAAPVEETPAVDAPEAVDAVESPLVAAEPAPAKPAKAAKAPKAKPAPRTRQTSDF